MAFCYRNYELQENFSYWYLWVAYFFSGVKRPGRGVNHPPSSSAEVKEGVELCLCFFSGTSPKVIGQTLLVQLLIFIEVTFCPIT